MFSAIFTTYMLVSLSPTIYPPEAESKGQRH